MRLRTPIAAALLLVAALAAAESPAATPTGAADEPWACRELRGMSCERELEEFLQTTEVIGIEDIGDGITHSRRVTLQKDGRQARAAFKTVDITSTELHYTRGATDPVPERVARGSRELDLEALSSELDGLLKPQQIRAVEARRRLLLEELSHRGVLPTVG